MEKNIIDFFKKVLQGNKNAQLPMNSFRGHLADLSQKERKYIRKMGLDKLINKYPSSFLLCDEVIYYIDEKDSPSRSTAVEIRPEEETDNPTVVPYEKSVNLQLSEDDPCTVCSDKIEIFAIGECQHPICFSCSTKLRILCEDKSCPVCRQKLDLVIFSRKLLPIGQHDISSYIKDETSGIAFENAKIYEQKTALLRHVCPICPLQVSFDSFAKLEDHAKSKHQVYYCEICVRQCKIFTHERKTYSKDELEKHQKDGDETGSARGGHPLCGFCETRYLDNDELLRHLRLHHCSCFICDEENEGRKNFQFFVNLQSLNDHYNKKHFTCEDPECNEDSGCTAVFKNEIDLQGHKLLKHSGTKSKLEKKQEQRIVLPNMFEREKVLLPERILKVEPDPVGGIHCTGFVIRRIEEKYSFIERDDAPNKFEENIFFDLESCGLDFSEDMKEHFQPYDRVRVYALPGAQNNRSKWKAQKVEKICPAAENVFNTNPFVNRYDFEQVAAIRKTSNELETDPFPALEPHYMGYASQTQATLGGWAKVANDKSKPYPAPIFTPHIRKDSQSSNSKITYEVGFVHKNLTAKFGFITKDSNEFLDNVYFNVENYKHGMSIYDNISLTDVLKPGDKVCYVLSPTKYTNVKANFKADLVWKYGHNRAESAIPVSSYAEEKKLTSKEVPSAVGAGPTIPMQSSASYERLAETYKRSLQRNEQKVNVTSLGVLEPSSGPVVVEEFMEQFLPGGENNTTKDDAVKPMPKPSFTFHDIQKYSQPPKEENPSITNGLRENLGRAKSNSFLAGHLSVQRNSSSENISVASSLKRSVDGENELKYSSSNSLTLASQKALSVKSNDDPSVHNSTDSDSEYDSSSSSEMYGSDESESEDEWEIEGNNCQCQKRDEQYLKFVETIETCLKNKALTKLLMKRIAEEMHKKSSKQPCNLQFLEFHKEKNTVYIMFYIMKDGKVAGTCYSSLTGDYPLESSWLGELKSHGLITKVSKDLYHILHTCHYITVTRNKAEKVSRITLHYRPLPGTHQFQTK